MFEKCCSVKLAKHIDWKHRIKHNLTHGIQLINLLSKKKLIYNKKHIFNKYKIKLL